MITKQRIEELASRRKCKRSRVVTWLNTMRIFGTAEEALGVLHWEAEKYGWPHEDVNAVQTGILEHWS